MAKRLFSSFNYLPTTVADGAALGSGLYQCLKGGSTTQTTDVLEVEISGMAGASAPTPMTLARVSVAETGAATALASPNADGPMHSATATLSSVVVAAIAFATTQVSRSNATTDPKINLGINAFGGILRWNASPTQQWTMVGNAVNIGYSVLSCQNYGTPGLLQSHIMYETY